MIKYFVTTTKKIKKKGAGYKAHPQNTHYARTTLGSICLLMMSKAFLFFL